MMVGGLPAGEPGVFRTLLLPKMADALAAGAPVTALALTQDDVAIGAVAGYLENERFQIGSLYVAPDYRRCGGGRMLLEELRELLEGHAAGMEISFTVTREEHQTLFPFLEVMGFEREEDRGETLYRTTLGAAAAAPFFAVGGKAAGTPLDELSDGALSLLNKAAMAAGAPVPEDGLAAKTVERKISLVRMNGSKPEAYVVFDTAWSGGLTLSAVWSGSKDPTVLPLLLRSAVTKVRENYPPETKVAVQAVNPVSAELIRKLLPEAEAISHTYYRPVTGRI